MFPQVSSVPFCDTCALSKSHQQPYKGKLPCAPYVGHTVHSDLSGKISPPSIGGGNYYLKMTNDYSRFKVVYIIKRKSDKFDAIKDYLDEVEQKHGTKVKVLVNNNGGEYLSRQLQNLLEENGTKMVLTAPYSPQQNPISERGNRTTSEKARALLHKSNLTLDFWGEAVTTSVFIENITPSPYNNNRVPYHTWHKSEFDLKRLRTFGCLCYVNIPKVLREGKFSKTSERGIFLGYNPCGKHNWRVLLTNGQITKSHDVIFDEEMFPQPFRQNTLNSSNMIEEEELPSSNTTDSPSSTTSKKQTCDNLNSSTQISTETARKPGWEIKLTSNKAPKTVLADLDESNILQTKRRAKMASINCHSPNPKNWNEAMRSLDRDAWVEALNNKLLNLYSRKVVEETNVPKDKRAIGFSVRFKRKFNHQGNLIKNKFPKRYVSHCGNKRP
ncbi:hypothetical protein O181_124723 [Austropuccinia psidii MF-1]|uniref:Integrase catalytic domain-containing protein n=1 Tax=Austropuccinia psidii MF-1 TaxID=1389203 RepID=A0A9Q3KP82_9BASI|nr:hypothetical protein [Austropuccinia psidii MF-1]